MGKEKDKKDKKEELSSDIPEELLLSVKGIEKKHGIKITTLDKVECSVVNTISTGSLSLDLALGTGGLAEGRIYEVYGPESSGKSTLAQHVAVQAQNRGHLVAYADAENALDKELFRSYGADLSRVLFISAGDGEQYIDSLEMIMKTGHIKVAIIDSVAALIPRAEADDDIDKNHMGLQGKLMSKCLRRLTPLAKETGTIVIFINQTRSKVGPVFGNPEITTGGVSLPYYATGRIKVTGGSAQKSLIIDNNSEGLVIGHTTTFEIKKNKLGPPNRKSEVKLIYGRGYDHHWEVLDIATDICIIDKSGSWYKYGDLSIGQGEVNTVQFLKDPENKNIFEEIMEKVIINTGLNHVYERHGQKGPIHP